LSKDRALPVETVDEKAPRRLTPEDWSDLRGPFAGFGTWLRNAVSIFASPQTIGWVLLCTIGLGAGYFIMLLGARNFGEDTTLFQNFGGFALISVSIVPILATLLLIAVLSNAIVEAAAEQEKWRGEWSDFSINDILGRFVYVGTSFWLAAIPGLVIGQILWFSTGFPLLMLFSTLLTSTILAPMFLSSVVYNDSALALMSSDALDSIWRLRNRWFRYGLVAVLFSAILTLTVPVIAFGAALGFLMAAIQVVLLFMLYWMAGDLVGYVVRYIEHVASQDAG
jgi:hypothetical protein